MYLQRQPGPALARHVEMLWYCAQYEAAHQRERVLPNGRFQLIIDLAPQPRPAIVVGMQTTCSILEAAHIQSVIGVVFRPGGAHVFFDPPADEFHGRPVALDEVWSSAGRLRDRLLEASDPGARMHILETALQQRLKESTELHGSVRYALREFGRNSHVPAISDVASIAGLSRRRFSALFRQQVGLTPKLYCRLSRFQQVVRRIAEGAPINWAQVSLDGGYYDQAHMAHEFREFSGVSPGAWAESDRPFLNHAVVD